MSDRISAFFLVTVLVAGLFVCSRPVPALADDPACTFSMTNVEFGSIDVKAGTPFDATGTFTYSCTGDAGQIIRICPSIGLDATPRTMNGSAGKLTFDLYSDPDHRVVWGTWFGNNPRSPIIDVPLNGSGTGVGSRIVFGEVNAGQPDVAPGTYEANFGSDRTSIGYAYAATGGSCGAIAHVHYRRVPFSSTATVK